jgi:hypothetical protein
MANSVLYIAEYAVSSVANLTVGTFPFHWVSPTEVALGTPSCGASGNIGPDVIVCEQSPPTLHVLGNSIYCNPILFAICTVHYWHIEECSVALLCN